MNIRLLILILGLPVLIGCASYSKNEQLAYHRKQIEYYQKELAWCEQKIQHHKQRLEARTACRGQLIENERNEKEEIRFLGTVTGTIIGAIIKAGIESGGTAPRYVQQYGISNTSLGFIDYGGKALGPITPNAYGPGIHMDATGRPFKLVPNN